MRLDPCPLCGAAEVGGFAGCDRLFHELGHLATVDLQLAAVHRLAVDAYCMQHVEEYGKSAKSYAAHLTGLCCGIEQAGKSTLYAALQRWLNGSVALDKPDLLHNRGSVTIADIYAIHESTGKATRIRLWAATVWTAYESQHVLARTWIQSANGASTYRAR